MGEIEKPVIWTHGEVKSPPFSLAARKEVGALLRRVQQGRLLPFPLSRPMPSIGPDCHELRITDEDRAWRIIYTIRPEAVYVIDVFRKTTRRTPNRVIDNCRQRLRRIQQAEWRAKHG
ncbi:MAG TPA: type II toxin-antitoxin system RelE/ParE family toxin [Longimicrobium sp.]|nr:type II toxin-antitoxin system RelE/ParE family toxin [Longimicrobium sp.]